MIKIKISFALNNLKLRDHQGVPKTEAASGRNVNCFASLLCYNGKHLQHIKILIFLKRNVIIRPLIFSIKRTDAQV